MDLKKIFTKLKQKDCAKENLYIKILLWANDKQESGFTWDEMKNNFKLNSSQEDWVKKDFSHSF